jgi:translation elongation factor EF-G
MVNAGDKIFNTTINKQQRIGRLLKMHAEDREEIQTGLMMIKCALDGLMMIKCVLDGLMMIKCALDGLMMIKCVLDGLMMIKWIMMKMVPVI